MNNTLDIYRDKIPNMAQRFLDEAKEQPDKFEVSISVNYGIQIKVSDKETGENLLWYYSQDNGTKDEGRVLRFWHNGYEYMISSKIKDCFFAIENDWETVIEQVLYSGKYRNNVNYYFDDFSRIFSIFMKSTIQSN